MGTTIRSYVGRHAGLLFILCLYLGMTWAYSYAIPFSKGPDEYINYQYILFIAKHGRLPVTVAERQEAGVKADWQPLYHLVGGVAATSVSLQEPPVLKVTWEPATHHLIDLILPRATLVRTADERSPQHGVYAVWWLGRLVSLMLGAGTLIITYVLALMIWPQQPIVAVGATALLAFIPRFLFTHAVLSDDTMLSVWLTLSLLLLLYWIRAVTEPKTASSGHWLVVAMGITGGLAIITKYAAIPIIGGLLLTMGIVGYQQKWSRSRLFKQGVLLMASLLAVVGWWVGWVWWHFSQIDELGPVMGLLKPLLPGATVDDNPTTTRLTAWLSGQSVADLGQAPGAGGTFFDWGWHSFITFWGVTVFGAEPEWPYPYWLILGGIALICLAALVGLGRAYRHLTPPRQMLLWTLVIHTPFFLPLPLLRFALSRRLNDAAQGRHLLFPAGAAIIILLMIGWLSWFRPQWRTRVALGTGGLMLLWGIGHWFYLSAAYPPPLPVRMTEGPQVQVEQSLHIDFGNILRLDGYETTVTDDGAVLKVDLRWQSLAQAWEDYQTELTLVDEQDQPRLRWLSHPAQGRFPVRAWQPGDIVRDTLYLPVVGLSKGRYTLQLRLLGWDEPLPATTNEEPLILSQVMLDTPPALEAVMLWQEDEAVPVTSPPRQMGLNFLATTRPDAMFQPYRYRSTIPVTVARSGTEVALISPDGQSHTPQTDVGTLRTFIVEYDWPSGAYQLLVEGVNSGLAIHVENFDTRRYGWTFTPPEMMYDVQANFGDQVELLGYNLPLRRVQAGGGIPLQLYWRGLNRMREDYTIFVQLLDVEKERWGGYDRFPRENYNTYLWVPGEIVDDGFAVPVEANAPPGVYTIRLGLYHQEAAGPIYLPLFQAGQPLEETSVVIGPLKIGGPPAEIVTQTISPEYITDINLGETIRLAGYDFEQTTDAFHLKLYWQSLRQTDIDYTVFIHLRHEAGKIVAQMDRPLAAGQYPSSLWDQGEIIPDALILPLPPDVEAGTYQLVTGLYDPASEVRLAVPDTTDNSVVLMRLTLD